MVEIIGILTITALIWLLAWAMGTENEVARRNSIAALHGSEFPRSEESPEQQTRRAA